MLAKLPRYWKTVIAVLGFIAVVGTEVVQAVANGNADGTLDTADIIKIVFVGITAVGVYQKSNTPPVIDGVQLPADPTVSETDPAV